ncbi:MAG TPA: hypothetical protein VEI73_13085 [Candidatus Acidoferrum sp.]|nr:hypothetical protein [Candidatus Acidoferrum sp.]
MPLLEQRQVSNLIFFLRDRWQIACQEATANEKNIVLSQEYISCAVLECFLWLDLGVQTNYFPKAEARRVAYEYFPQFLKAYEHIQEEMLIQKFSPPLQRILESEFSGRTELFSLREGLNDLPEEILTPLQAVLLLTNGFASDSDTQAITDSLVFKKPPEWDDVMREFKEVNERAERGSKRFIQARDAMSSTVLKIVQYMECFRNVLLDFDKSANVPQSTQASGTANLKQRVKEIQAWRLDFKEGFVFDRFLEFLRLAIELWRYDVKDGPIELRTRITPALVRAVRVLMTDWGAPPLAMEVGR